MTRNVRTRLLAPALLALAGCPDLGDTPMDWSTLDRPEPPKPVDAAVPPDAGDGAVEIDASDPPPEHADVLAQNIAFNPMVVRIVVGGTVTWYNLDLVQHDIRSGSPAVPTALFNSGLMDRGDAFTFRFTQAGRYEYYCSTHANVMFGAIVEVVEAGS